MNSIDTDFEKINLINISKLGDVLNHTITWSSIASTLGDCFRLYIKRCNGYLKCLHIAGWEVEFETSMLLYSILLNLDALLENYVSL